MRRHRVGSFFVPIFNLFKPYEAVDELFFSSDRESGPDGWGAGAAPRYIHLWWVTWIGFGVSSAPSARSIRA